MKRNIDRILTTHTGSLPRPMDLAAMLEGLESGKTPDAKSFETRVRAAVSEMVSKQVESGVDVVSDGEQGKVAYSTCVRHRLTGFEEAKKKALYPSVPTVPTGPTSRRQPPARPRHPRCPVPHATVPSSGKTGMRCSRLSPTLKLPSRPWTRPKPS